MIGHFFFGIAFAFGNGHQQGGIGSHWERTCFVGINVCVVNHNHSACWKRGEGFVEAARGCAEGVGSAGEVLGWSG